MPENKDDRLNQFERALSAQSVDPTVAKFAPKKYEDKAEESIETLVARIRTSVKTVTDLCDELDKAIAESEKHARIAADSLMDMIKRVR